MHLNVSAFLLLCVIPPVGMDAKFLWKGKNIPKFLYADLIYAVKTSENGVSYFPSMVFHFIKMKSF